MISRHRHIHMVIAVVAGLAASRASADDATFDYTVRSGDSCRSIAKDLYGNSGRIDLVHRHNHLGPPPHVLSSGQVLILPAVAADANLTAAQGRVQARAPKDTDWRAAGLGLRLFRAWRVGTLAEALAEITFTGGDQLRLRENTIVVIHGASAPRVRSQPTAELASGALVTRLGELTGGRKVAVRTPSSDTELDSGATLITVDGAGATRLANHGGKPARVASRRKRAKPVVVADGMGSKVEMDHEPTPPRPLPPTPSWADDSAGMLSVDGGKGTLRAEWIAVALAQRYRIEVTRDPAGLVSVDTIDAPGHLTAFELVDVPPGEYYLRIASVDADQFESKPSPRRRFDLVALELTAPDGKDGQRLSTTRVPIGTRVRAASLVCAVDDGAPTPESTVRQSGDVTLRCQRPGEPPFTSVALQVPSFEVRVIASAFAADRRLVRGVPTPIEIEVPASLARVVRLVGGPGVEVGEVVPIGTDRVQATITADSSGAVLEVMMPIEGEAPLTLGTVSLLVAPAVKAPSDLSPPWSIGLVGIHQPFGGDEDAPYRLALGIGRRLNPRAALELEASLGVDEDAKRAGGRFRLVRTLSVARPWLLGGLGLGVESRWPDDPRESSDTVGVVEAGLGGVAKLPGELRFRGELSPRFTTDGDFAIQLRAGVWLGF